MQEKKRNLECRDMILFGNKNAKVKIRIFSDINCGYCKIASEKYRHIFYNDTTVCIQFFYFPLNHRKSNIQVNTNQNTFLYRVMFAASKDEEFWNFHDQIIKKAENQDHNQVFGIAKKTLKNFDDFKQKLSAENYTTLLKENILLAEEYDVKGTPTIFINDREFQQWTNISLLKMIISSIKMDNLDRTNYK
jgi:protein-disulfide isomerase